MALHLKKKCLCRQTNHTLIKKLELDIAQLINCTCHSLSRLSAFVYLKSIYKSLWVRCEPTQWQPSWKQTLWASAASENSCCEREAAPRSTHPALPLYINLSSAFQPGWQISAHLYQVKQPFPKICEISTAHAITCSCHAFLQPKLLNGILASHNDADSRKHRKAAVIDLSLARNSVKYLVNPFDTSLGHPIAMLF